MLSESTASIQTINVALEVGRVVSRFVTEQLEDAERKREEEASEVDELQAARVSEQEDLVSDDSGDGSLSDSSVDAVLATTGGSGDGISGSVVDIEV